MQVCNMLSNKGKKIPNQFIISSNNVQIFQSYDSIICKIENGKVYLDKYFWKYSATTSKYRALFLGESTKETQKKIDSGEYILTSLN